MLERHIRIIIIGLLWAVISFTPFAFQKSVNWFYAYTSSELSWGYISLCFLRLGEVFVLSTLIGINAKYIRSNLCNIVIVCITASYLIFTGANWYYHSHTESFITINLIKASLAGTTSLLRWTPFKDMLAGATAVSVGVLLAFACIHPIQKTSRQLSILFMSSSAIACYAVAAIYFMGYSKFLGISPPSANAKKIFANCFSPVLTIISDTRIQPISQPVCVPEQILDSKNKNSKTRNVIVVLIEALRSDTFKLENAANIMPNMTTLAQNGVSYKRAYAASSESSYSNIAVITGMHALKNRWRDTFTIKDANYLPLYDRFTDKKISAGYFAPHEESWQNVNNIVQSESLDLFFDGVPKATTSKLVNSETNKGHERTIVADALMVENLQKWLSKKGQSDRFFSRLYFVSTHSPYFQPPKKFQIMPVSEVNLENFSFLSYNKNDLPNMWNRYLNTVHYVDYLIGLIIETLQQYSLLDNTTIIITGDHGQQFGEHNKVTHANSLYEPVIHVPLIISNSHPWDFLPDNTVVSHVDIAPTTLELLGVPIANRLHGSSLTANTPRNSPTISSIQSIADADALIDWPWKVIQYNDEPENVSIYNLMEDPGELRPLKPSHSYYTNCLANTLATYRQELLWYYAQSPHYKNRCIPPKLRFSCVT